MIHVGYHLTPVKNWPGIQREGLHPYQNTFEALPYKEIIWLWKRRPKSILLDLCLDQYARGNGTDFVLLRVKYQNGDNPESDTVLRHRQTTTVDGSRGKINKVLHDNVPAFVLTKSVPPEQIEKIAEVELMAKEGNE